MITCLSGAKVNLSLDVLSRRADGYHELQSIVHTVGLWDKLLFEFGVGHGFSLRCSVPHLSGDDNLCVKAARAWLAEAHKRGPVRLRDLRITLQKTIPTGAGLGGGSGNAAATLLAINHQFDDCLDKEALARVAASVGADVPLFLRGGCVLMEGIGERLTPLSPLHGWLVLAQPERLLSTPAMYRRWDAMEHTSRQATITLRPAVTAHDLLRVAAALGNDLALAAQAEGLDVEHMIEALRRRGALGAGMTGSGSCVFGIFLSEDEARAALEQLGQEEDRHLFRHLFMAPFSDEGVRFFES